MWRLTAPCWHECAWNYQNNPGVHTLNYEFLVIRKQTTIFLFKAKDSNIKCQECELDTDQIICYMDV